MKHIRLFSLAAVIFASWGCSLPAQSTDQQGPPSPPYLRGAPARCKWEIHFTYGDEGNPAAASSAATPTPTPDLAAELPPRLVEVTFTLPIWYAAVTDKVGRKTEVWFDGYTPYLILPKQQPNAVASDDLETLPSYLNFTAKKTSFPDMEWVSIKTYTGREDVNGTPCIVFKKPGDADITVWINDATRYPVRWMKGTETRDFVFDPTPPARLTLPLKIQQIAKAMEVVRENNNRKPARGG